MTKCSIQDNMDIDNLPLPGQPPLRRTYKAYCPFCKGMATSYVQSIREVPCEFCTRITIPTIQKYVRSFLVKKKLKKLKQKEATHRWFTINGVNGKDFSDRISSFL